MINLRKSKAILFGTVFGVIVCALMLMMFAFAFVKMKKLPHDIIDGITLFCAAVSSFSSGYVSVRFLKENGLLYGLLSGLIFFLILFTSSLFVSNERLSTVILLKATVTMLSGAVGGVLSVNKRERVR